MAERKIEVVISAADQYSQTLDRFNTSIGNTADNVDASGGKMQTRFDSVGGSIAGVHAAWIKMAGVVAASAWLIDSAKQALDGEKAMNQLRIQVEALGLDYHALEGQIESALAASSKYAAVQDDEVAAIFKQLIFLTGDYNQSIQNLNLVLDLAYQKNISHEEAATLVGKAMTGNIEALGRIIPEFKNLDDSLGKNATSAEKAALAMDLLRGKVSGAVSEMTDHERKVAEVTLAYNQLKEAIGNVALELASLTLKNLRAPLDWFASASHAVDVLAGKLNDNIVVSAEAAGNALQEQTHPLSQYSEGLKAGAKAAGDMAEELGRLKARMDAMGDQGHLGGSAFTSMFSPVSLSAGEITNPIMAALDTAGNAPAPDTTPIPESDADIWEAEMERIIAAKEREATAITGYDELIARGIEGRANISGRAYQAYENQLLSVIETGKFSVGSMAQIIASQGFKIELVGLAARASIWAIYETAMGLRDLAVGSPTAALHFASALKFGAVAGGAMIAAASVQALVGGTAERPAPGTVGGEPLRVTSSGGGFLPSSTQVRQSQNITLNIYNPLSDQNWQKVIEDNIIPAINAAGDRNVKISVNSVGA